MPTTNVSRRSFLKRTLVGVAASQVGRALDVPAARASTHLLELSATEVLPLMRRGDVKAEDYAAALLARCAAGQPLNAFISFAPDQVKQAARDADRRRSAGKFL